MRRFALRPLILPSLLLTALAGQSAQAYDYTAPVPLRTTAKFDPTTSTVPFPTDLLRQGSTDLTLNIPVASGTPASQAAVYGALNSLDGFSTIAPWSTGFSTALTASSVATTRVRPSKILIVRPLRAASASRRQTCATVPATIEPTPNVLSTPSETLSVSPQIISIAVTSGTSTTSPPKAPTAWNGVPPVLR